LTQTNHLAPISQRLESVTACSRPSRVSFSRMAGAAASGCGSSKVRSSPSSSVSKAEMLHSSSASRPESEDGDGGAEAGTLK